MSEYRCENCETPHGTIEEAKECCQCESCVVPKAQLKASEDYATTLTGTHPDDVHKSRDERIETLQAQLKAAQDEIQDCRDSWAPDQPPSDVAQFLIDLESVLEQEAGE
jgi:hypothetical protein